MKTRQLKGRDPDALTEIQAPVLSHTSHFKKWNFAKKQKN